MKIFRKRNQRYTCKFLVWPSIKTLFFFLFSQLQENNFPQNEAWHKIICKPISRHSCYTILWYGGLRELEAKLSYAYYWRELETFFSLWHATKYDRIIAIWMGTLHMYVPITNEMDNFQNSPYVQYIEIFQIN